MSILLSISAQRFRPYLVAAGHDQSRALSLCLWNIKLSEAFYPTIQAVEVSLRNHVQAAVEAAHGPDWWRSAAFRADLGRGAAKLDEAVRGAGRKAAGKRRPMTGGDVVAELTFGFWTRMLDNRHGPAIWSHLFNQTFPHAPAGVDHRLMKRRLDPILDLRNRVFHHEPIFRRDALRDHGEVMEALTWINPSKADWIRPHSRLPDIVRRKPQ